MNNVLLFFVIIAFLVLMVSVFRFRREGFANEDGITYCENKPIADEDLCYEDWEDSDCPTGRIRKKSKRGKTTFKKTTVYCRPSEDEDGVYKWMSN